MKKKTLIISALVLCTISLLIGPGMALPTETQTAIINRVVSTTINDEYPTFSKIAMIPEQNYPFNVHIEGDQPGEFTYVNYENDTIGTPYNTIDEKGYPTSLGTLKRWDNDFVANPWDVEWLHLSNNELESGESATYNVSLSSLPLGALGPGVPTEFDSLMASDYLELELIATNPGLYVLYFDSETTLSSVHLISSSGNEIDTVLSSLPSVSASDGDPIRKFLTFFGDTSGSYRLFFRSNTRYITFELDSIPLTSEIEFGDRIIYKDEDYENIDPAVLQGTGVYFPVHYYSFPVSAGDYLRLNFAQVWGTPIVKLISPTLTGYEFSAIDVSGQDSFKRFSYTGTAYIVVLHNNYFKWQYPYAITNVPLYYKFGVYDEGVPTYSYELGTNEVFSVDPFVQNAIIEFNVTEPTSMHLNYSIHQGGVGAYDPDSDFFLVRNDTGYFSIDYLLILSGNPNDFYYDLVPGIYQLFIHSTSTLQNDMIEFQSEILSRTEVAHKSHTKEDDTLLKSDTSQMESSYFYEEDTFSVMYPSTVPFSYDDSVGFGYNISLYPTDNPQIFNRAMPTSEIQVWLWNGTAYVNQTYNQNALDLFIDGDANNYPAYFGAVRPFNKIGVNLQSFSSSMDFTWQYLDDDANNDWEDLDILFDGTNATGSTLSQSGIISFDFDFALTELNYVNDPDWGDEMPNVNKEMFWFRLDCAVDSPASIPAISGYSSSNPPVKLYQYTQLWVDLKSEIHLESNYDNRTYLQVGGTEDETLLTNSFSDFDSESFEIAFGGGDGIFGTGDAIISYWPYEVYERDYSQEGITIYVPITQAVNFRIATFDDVDHYLYADYSSIGSTPANLTLFNFTSYDTYGYSGSFNASDYDGVVLSVEGEMYDWYQFIYQSDNTANSITTRLLFDNVWTDIDTLAKANVYNGLFVGSSSNNSAELGIAPSTFKLVFEANAFNTSELVEFRLNIASYGIQLLTPNLTLVESTVATGVPSWVLPTSIGGGVAIIAIVGGVVVYKKKHPL
ncbi:MAG: hypothetical protein ACTSYI_04215 [Promethearchaeota archaeon]